MNKRLNALIAILIVGTLTFSLPLVMFAGGADDTGGTEGTVMDADVGGGFEWNEVHGFVIFEDGVKVDEEFNVTICESVKYVDDKASPSGYIYEELTGIHWDDSPEPSIFISEEDFDSNSEDGTNLTVKVYGDWYDGTQPAEEDRDRWAYKTITFERPNNPPEPVAWVTAEGNWTWFNLSEENDVTFVVEEGNDITLWFDASHSWDPDGEAVTEWKWDLDEDGIFGGAGETGENKSKVLTTGKSYNLGLKVWDERSKESETSLDFTIRIQSPARLPDLTVSEVSYENKNQNKQNYEVGDHIIVQPRIDNIGENDTDAPFKVLLEYSSDGGDNYVELIQIDITEVIRAGNFKLLTHTWNTEGYTEGNYILKATADLQNVIGEEFEDNNENTTNLVHLEPRPEDYDPDLSIEFVSATNQNPKVNEEINITISVINEGQGDANYVDVHYDINEEFKYFKTFELIPAGTNDTIQFTFSGDAEGPITLGYQLKDDGNQVGDRETIQITVKNPEDPNGNGPEEPENGENGGSGFIPGFEVLAVIGAIMSAFVVFNRRRRR